MTISAIYDEASRAEQSALVELFVLKLPASLAEKFPELAILRFAKAPNEKGEPIVWQGNTFLPIPLEADGFEINSKGSLPRPTLTIANVDGLLSGLLYDLDDMVGVRVQRLRTFEKYLDAVNFHSGVNPTANPNYFLPTERFIIERKNTETNTIVSFELASHMDLHGVKIPLRTIERNVCRWRYRGDGCGYSGDPVADANDARLSNTMTHAEKMKADTCSHTYAGCRLRFPGAYDELPFGAFPSITIRDGGD